MNDLTLLNEALDVYRPFPISKKNVGQVVATVFFSDPLSLTELINRVTFLYGGSRLNSVCKVAQSMLAYQITVTNSGKVEMGHV